MKDIVKCNAKINIGLNVLNKRDDGYHELDMIMAPINLFDTLEINYFDETGDLKITTNKKDIPTGKSNILYKTYLLFFKYSNIKNKKIEINLLKEIPSEAGLGGGSSDAAHFLKYLNKKNNLILNQEVLLNIAKEIGADVSFFIYNKSARINGIGEKIEFIENNFNYKLLLIKPRFGVSSGYAYNLLKNIKAEKTNCIDNIIIGLRKNNKKLVENNIKNTLEEGLLLKNSNLINFKKELQKFTEVKFFMSGSGSTYFTFISKENIDLFYSKFIKKYSEKEYFIKVVTLHTN